MTLILPCSFEEIDEQKICLYQLQKFLVQLNSGTNVIDPGGGNMNYHFKKEAIG